MTVVYASNRKWYPHLPTAVGSLLSHNPDAFVYIIGEDDEIPQIKRKKNIKILNINNFPDYIDKTHPNATSHWTLFALVRCFLTKMIPEDKVLWLDVDTIVLADLTELWEMDMTDAAIAGWKEEPKNWVHVRQYKKKSKYVNSGVLLMNLKFIKEQGFDDEFIKCLNGAPLKNPDQDALNIVCDGYIKYIGAEYNYGYITPKYERMWFKKVKIYHMTWYKLWDNPRSGPWGLWESYYRETLW